MVFCAIGSLTVTLSLCQEQIYLRLEEGRDGGKAIFSLCCSTDVAFLCFAVHLRRA